MSYQVMARRWRPRTLDALIGHDWVVRALSYALSHNRMHHAYLLTGTRGVGKTTLARILARSLNCATGPTPHPCGTCAHCLAMDAGHAVDVMEVDAASKTKVEETRSLLDNVPYAPVASRYKIYIIDEVHMLSAHSFNALLKTLEEPPAHVYFMLATTEWSKVPDTIRSRCLPIPLKPIPAEVIQAYLARQLAADHIPFEPDALRPVAEAGQGSVRDTLTQLEPLLAYGQGALRVDAVHAFLGAPEPHMVAALLTAIHQQDVSTMRQMLETAWANGRDPDRLLQAILVACKDLAWLQCDPDPQHTALLQWPEQAAHWQTLAAAVSPFTVHNWYEIAMRTKMEMDLHPMPHVACEMGLIRMMVMHASTGSPVPQSAPVPSERLASLSGGSAPLVPSTPPMVPPAVPSAVSSAPTAPPVPATVSAPPPCAGLSPDSWITRVVSDLCGAQQTALNSFDQNILWHTVCLQYAPPVLQLGVCERAHAIFRLAPHEHQPMAQRLITCLQAMGYPEITRIAWELVPPTRSGETPPLTPFAYKTAQQLQERAVREKKITSDPAIVALQSTFSDLAIQFYEGEGEKPPC